MRYFFITSRKEIYPLDKKSGGLITDNDESFNKNVARLLRRSCK